ncbi:hypothetical protein NPN18_26725, partial [Vibrio parahaemolyticus]|nr:hypothetical protein [Vibrio parahaemolyticus]
LAKSVISSEDVARLPLGLSSDLYRGGCFWQWGPYGFEEALRVAPVDSVEKAIIKIVGITILE